MTSASMPGRAELELNLDLPIPLNLIAKALCWTKQRVTKVLLYKTYVRSHMKWNSRHQLGAWWRPLGDHLQYSLRLAQPTDPHPHVSRLALKSTGQTLANVDFYFEASGAGVRYQERISACDVNQTPIIWTLTNVPVLKFIGGEPDGIAFSVEEVQLRQCVVRVSNGEVLPPCNSMRSDLTQSWLMSDDWAYQWGHWWNCNAIKFAKGELAMYWRWWFGRPRDPVYTPLTRRRRNKSMLTSLLRGLGGLMALPPIVTVQFWLAIWSGLCVLDRNDRLAFRWRAKRSENI